MQFKWQMSIPNWFSVAYLLQQIANIMKLWWIWWDNTTFWLCGVPLTQAMFIIFLQTGLFPKVQGILSPVFKGNYQLLSEVWLIRMQWQREVPAPPVLKFLWMQQSLFFPNSLLLPALVWHFTGWGPFSSLVFDDRWVLAVVNLSSPL